MENIYLILIVVLFALAISDLIVGVSNDAVNFLNSAIGSKVAKKWLIFTVAALGVLAGSTFSSGMMEVARKGIFHPEMFMFSEIIIIFLAVMITDVILLDTFNSLGLPTSTTVSIVFELLGAAVAVSLVKINHDGGTFLDLGSYINSEKALMIIFGILLSVVVAFSVGALVQYLARLWFSFNYAKTFKYFGSLFTGIAVTAITYFILVKGLKDSSFAGIELGNGESLSDWFKYNTILILLVSFFGWWIIMEVLKSILKLDILKIVVLIGTFALAMAFAGNDLVNFIGVPIAGYNSYQAWMASGGVAPDAFSMIGLQGKVETPTIMLVIAGFIMIVTLITSKKAHAVVTTGVDLSRQADGEERFGSSRFSRMLVRNSIQINKRIVSFLPKNAQKKLSARFIPVLVNKEMSAEEQPAFDKIRAVSNLVVASILIAIGTSMKLPLSTTYVTFMVAMGTSLADKAWDRESAVYRISGVFTIIMGWFLTSIIAFSVAAFVAWIVAISHLYLVFLFIAIAIFMGFRTHLKFKKQNQDIDLDDDDISIAQDAVQEMKDKSIKNISKLINRVNQNYESGLQYFLSEDLVNLKKQIDVKDKLYKKTHKRLAKIFDKISGETEDIIANQMYIQVVENQKALTNSLHHTLQPLFEHLSNQHKPFLDVQENELAELVTTVVDFNHRAIDVISNNDFENLEELKENRKEILDYLSQVESNQIKRIKNKEVNTRNSILFFNTINETKNNLIQTVGLLNSHRNFMLLLDQTE